MDDISTDAFRDIVLVEIIRRSLPSPRTLLLAINFTTPLAALVPDFLCSMTLPLAAARPVPMAALRPCPVRITAPASSNLTRSQPRYASINLPLDRSNTMLKIRAPLDRSSTLLKTSHAIHAHNGAAGQPRDPEEFFLSLLTPEEKKIWERAKKTAKGPPYMPFREEIDIIDDYWKKARDEIIHNESILHAKGASLSCILCSRVHHAAVLASKVVDCAALRLGSPDEISLHTTTQIMRTYVSVFVRTAEENHHKKVTRETIISFLGALQGVASISHILVQDTLAYRALIGSKDTSSDYQINDSDVDRAHLEYQVEMNNLKDKLTAAHPIDVYELLKPTLNDAMRRTQVCVMKMTGTRKMALRQMRGAVAGAPSDDK